MNINPDDNSLYAVYIGGLVFKNACKEPLTEQELTDLASWRAGSVSRNQLFEQLQERTVVSNDIRKLNSKYDAEAAVIAIFDQLNIDKRTLKSKQRPVLTMKRGLPAAAAIILLFIGAWYFIARPKESHPVASYSEHPENDILPGGNKAILTLANGSTIVLDSAHNGNLAWQGSAQVVKTNEELSYTTASNGGEIVYNIMTTPRGGQYQLVLQDGTRVWLNAASSIRYPTVFQGRQRVVELTGEGYFEVAKNTAMPFIVKSGTTDVTVLGTHFNINAYDDEKSTRVTLLEGGVKVNNAVILSPGQQAVVGAGLRVVDNIDTAEVVAWKDSNFQFSEHTDFGAIMRQVARWYDVSIVYHGDITKHVGGTISREVTLSHLLRVLEATGTVHFKQNGRTIEVFP